MKRAPDTALPPPNSEVSLNEKEQITTSSAPSMHTEDGLHTVKFSQKQLINKLNHLNFSDHKITIIFKHIKYARTLTLTAQPLPCDSEKLVCNWTEPIDIEQLIESYQFECFYLPKDQQLLEVKPELKTISDTQIAFILPQMCHEVSERKIDRYRCRDVSVYMFQNSALFCGELVDYGASQFRIQIHKTPPQTYRWIDANSPATIVFTKGPLTLFSGQCRIVKQDMGQEVRHLILEPINRQLRRFTPRQFRSSRQKLMPSPDVVFNHPFFSKSFSLKVFDISGSGFSVEEEGHLAVLLPGMILPEADLRFSDGVTVRCMAQVVHSKLHHQSHLGPVLRCGLAILDMAVNDHIKLLALLHQASDSNAYLCHKVDMESLWNFFFETGFIYPEKYEFIQANKEKIKATYEKLYHQSPSIASHFIYQENGRILAHMAMIRFYEKSWLIHHHAAVRSSYNRGGLMVLNHVGRFINDSYRLASMKMDYVFCYFRPENKFPSQVFGGTARNIRNPQICSLDTLAYVHYTPDKSKSAELPNTWQLAPADNDDLLDLQTFYDNHSGGLMLRGLHLQSDQVDGRQLTAAFHRIGLKRDRHIMALRHRDRLCALVVVDVADLGLNMSDLTSSVKFIIVNSKHLTLELIRSTITSVSHYLELNQIPVLFYPKEAADQVGVDYEKTYCMWVYDTHRNIDHYYKFLKRLLKFIKP